MIKQEGSIYQKVISILFAGLLGATGIIWNNSQHQISDSLAKIEKLMEVINSMQKDMAALDYKIEMLQYQMNNINYKIDNIPSEKDNTFPSNPKFERK